MFKLLHVYGNIDSTILFKIKAGKITRGHDLTLVKDVRSSVNVQEQTRQISCKVRLHLEYPYYYLRRMQMCPHKYVLF